MKRIIFACACFALAGGLMSAETVVTVDSAVESALKSDVSIRQNAISYDALGRKSANSWNVFVPSVNVGASAARGTNSEITSYSGNLSASLSVFPSAVKAIEKTRLEYEAGGITRETALREVERSVRKSFYSLIYERENVAFLESTVETARKQYEQTLAKQRAGLVPEVDLLSAQVTYENLKPTLETARIAFQNDLDSFKQILGVGQDEEISLQGSLDEALTLTKIDLSGIVDSSSKIMALEKSLEIAQVAKQSAKAGSWLPSFSVAWSWNPAKTDVAGSEWEDAGSVSASVSFALDNLLPFSSSAENIRAAEDAVQDVTLQLADAKITTDREKQSMLRNIDQSFSSVKARTLSVSLAERNYSLMEEAYKHGTKDILSLQNSADSLREAKVALMKESYTLISAILDLEYALGVPFGTLGR